VIDNAFCWRLITAIHRQGSDASDIRDAAHEACHALDAITDGAEPRKMLPAQFDPIGDERIK
jgi:hypothetical protein